MAHILVVDDDDLVRKLVLRWLTSWGYTAEAVRNADEALTSMATSPADVMLIDITMPGHNGVWLLQEVRRLWPATRAIMISGAQDAVLIQESRKHGALAFVPKPIERELLRQALERASGLP